MAAHLPVCVHGTLVGLPLAGRAIIFVYARVTHALEDGEVDVGGVRRQSDHSEIAYDRKGCAKSHFPALRLCCEGAGSAERAGEVYDSV